MKVFRFEQRKDVNAMGWIYKGQVNLDGQTTFGELLPSDRVAYDFPDEDSDCESMETAQEAGLVKG